MFCLLVCLSVRLHICLPVLGPIFGTLRPIFIKFLPRDAMHTRYMLWLCVCVTSRCSTKTAEHRGDRITQTKPHESSGTLVFWCQRSPSHPCTLSLCITPELGDEAEQVEAEYGQVEEHDADELDVVLDEPVPRLQRVSVRVALGRRTRACEAPDQRQTHHRTGLS